ncbi:hypothetical protein O7632_03085 [Solwaraspora sp. WMMD406]|uniref:LppU/SCO3897 family protein n=1 Tax=Solwaraspora sp. WMMD406 TaxID=3016095 RepID=UPI00241662CD|nr:hypothetical protein [Solwaraspora sp. WMMD406]MDG4763100.1 hypothetical protein [Solwaraspora sp. WMMD406]
MAQYGPPGGPYPGQQPDRWPDREPPEQYREPSDPWGGNDPWGDTPAGQPAPSGPADGYSTQPGYGGQGWTPQREQPWQGASGPDQPWSPDGGDQHWSATTAQPGGSDQNWNTATRPAGGWAGEQDSTWQVGAGQPAAPAPGPAWEPGGGGAGRPPKRGGFSTTLVAVVIGLAVLLCGGGATGVYLMTRPDQQQTELDQTLPTTDTQVVPTVDPPAPTETPDVDQTTPAPTPTPTSSNDARFVSEGQCVRNEAPSEDETPVLTITECDDGTYEVLARFDGVTDGEEDAKTKCADVEGYTNWYFFNSQLDALDFVLCLRQR